MPLQTHQTAKCPLRIWLKIRKFSRIAIIRGVLFAPFIRLLSVCLVGVIKLCSVLNSCIYCSADISSDTFSRRYATSASALARESLEKHLTNESWQPPIGKGHNGLQPHRLRHFITGSSSKPCEPEEHSVEKTLQKHRSKYDDPCGLLTRSRPGYLQPNSCLICKYVPCDQFQDYVKERKPNRRELSKPKKEQIQINRAIEKFLMSKDNMELLGLSTKIKKTYSPKRVSFHHPDLVEKNTKCLVMSSKTSSHWKEQKNQSNHLTNLDLKKCSNPQERNKGGKWLTDPQILQKKRTNQSDFKGKIKGQNLRIKLNLNPFRKVRVHPEKSLAEFPKKHRQVSPSNKFSKVSEKEAKINLVSSADFHQQSEINNYVRFTAKRLPLKHAPKQTPYYRKNIKKAPLFSADNLSVANQSSMEGNCHPTGHIPDGNPSTLHQPTPTVTEHRQSHSPVSTEQVGGAAHLALGIPCYLPATLENIGRDILPSHHFRGATDQGVTEPTENMEQDKSKISELNQFSLSLGNQIHRTETYKEHTLDQNQTLQHAEQLSSHEQLGNEEKTLMTEPKISHPIVEICVMGEGNDVEKKLPKTETYDSSPISQTQSKGNFTFMKTNSIPYQNKRELPKDISTSLSTQAIWPLTNSSEKGIDSTNALPRDDGTEALQIKIVGKEEKKMFDESKANSSMLIRTTQMTLNGTTKEKQQTWENGKSEKHI